MKKILVLGGTGFVGRHLCEKLSRLQGPAQHRITVPTRSLGAARGIQSLPLVDVVLSNVHDEQALANLVEQHDIVINLIAILHGTQDEFQKTHVDLVSKIVRAAVGSKVQQVIHVSALGAASDAPSKYLRSKAAGELALAPLSQAGIHFTVLRPSVIFGADDQFLNLFAKLQALFPVMPLACASAKFQPVWVEDVAQAIVRCLHGISHSHKKAQGLYLCCGPEIYSLRELVALTGTLSGHPRPIVALGDALGRLQAMAMEFLPGPTLMSRDNVDSMQVDNVADQSAPHLEALGIGPSALSAIAPTYLRPGSALNRYLKNALHSR